MILVLASLVPIAFISLMVYNVHTLGELIATMIFTCISIAGIWWVCHD